jgi:hypothetical protein
VVVNEDAVAELRVVEAVEAIEVGTLQLNVREEMG